MPAKGLLLPMLCPRGHDLLSQSFIRCLCLLFIAMCMILGFYSGLLEKRRLNFLFFQFAIQMNGGANYMIFYSRSSRALLCLRILFNDPMS